MSLSILDVRNLIPVDLTTISDELIQEYIDIVTETANLELNNIFPDSLVSVVESDCQNYSTANTFGTNFVPIGAWQETGLTIKKTSLENSHKTTLSESQLTLGNDYALWYGFKGRKIPGKNMPVTAIKLYRGLFQGEVLRVYGTYGWQEGYPADIKNTLVQIVISLAGYANSIAQMGGISGIKRVKDMTTEIELSDEMSKTLRDQARIFLDDSAYQSVIAKYKFVTEESISII